MHRNRQGTFPRFEDCRQGRFPNGGAYLLFPDGFVLPIPSGGVPEGDPGTEGGTGGGGAGGNGTGEGGQQKRLSLHDLNWDEIDVDPKKLPPKLNEIIGGIVQRDRKSMRTELEDTRTNLAGATSQIEALKTEHAELKAALEEFKNPPPPGEDPNKLPPALTKLAKNPETAPIVEAWKQMRAVGATVAEANTAIKGELEAVKQQLADAQAAAEKDKTERAKAEDHVMKLRKEREVLGILSDLEVLNPEREVEYYAQRLVYDANSDSFVHRTADGDTVKAKAFIKGDVPAHLIKSDVTAGGSGSHGSHGTERQRPEAPKDKLTRLTQERDELKTKGQRGAKLSEAEQMRLMQLGAEISAARTAAA